MQMKVLGRAAVVAALMLAAACGDDEPEPEDTTPADPATTSVEVHFRDSSVPPEYHRSWNLTLDREQVHLVVDSYGDVLADETVAMPAAEWGRFVADLVDAVDDLDEPEAGEDGCAGGTGLELDIDDAGSATTSMDLDNCASDHNLAITEDIEELVKPFTDLVDLEDHTRT